MSDGIFVVGLLIQRVKTLVEGGDLGRNHGHQHQKSGGGSKRSKDQGGRAKMGEKEGGLTSIDNQADKRQRVSRVEEEPDSPSGHQGAAAESAAEGTGHDEQVHIGRMNG